MKRFAFLFFLLFWFMPDRGVAFATTYETGPQEQTWNVYDVTWQDWKQFKVVVGGTDVWTSDAITAITVGDNFYTVPTYQQEGTFSWQIQARHKNGAPLGGGVTGWGVIDSGTATEVSSFHQYDAYFDVVNDTGAPATFTVRWWSTADPGDVSKQHTSVFDLAPGNKVAVHLREMYPFTYDVMRQDQDIQVDGSVIVPEPVEHMPDEDSTDTEVEVEPEDPIRDIGQPKATGDVPEQEPDTERPNATADTTAKLDQNQDARAQDARNDAGRIAQAASNTTAAVSALDQSMSKKLGELAGSLNASGEGDGPSEDLEDNLNEAEENRENGAAKATYGKLVTLSGSLNSLVSAWNISVGSAAAPSISWAKPAALGGGTVSFNFSTYSSVFSIIRAALFLVLCWVFITGCLSSIREAMS